MIEDNLYLKNQKTEGLSAGELPSSYYMLGLVDAPVALGAPLQMDNVVWTLDTYRQGVDGAKETGEEAKEAWDELEKSILANLADDLIVAIRGDEAEITVVKKFAKTSDDV